MNQRIKRNAIALAVGLSLGALLVVVSGCSTVSGFAKDLGDASEGIRDAMTQE